MIGSLDAAERTSGSRARGNSPWLNGSADMMSQALERVATEWTGLGAGDVTHWLDSLPVDSGRNAAIEGFAQTVMSVSPDDALAWLRAVPNETDRLARLRRAWQSWSDRDAARRWLENSTDLTDAERSALWK